MEPRRVLLVDDEPQIVAGLQRLLRPHRASWQVTTATSGAEALALMDASPFDVVVSDMRMPGMDGAALLTIARDRHPATMRVLLSGQTDAGSALRVFSVAHQFLSKPTPSALLIETLQRVAKMRDQISEPAVLAAIGGVDALPALPAVCHDLGALIGEEDVTVEALAAVVETDPAIVAKLLQVVNSAFFGSRRRIADVTEAIVHLGTEQLENLVLAIAIASSLSPRAALFDAGAHQEHAVAVARMTRLVAGSGEIAASSFACGLLHDVGKLVMASRMPVLFDAITTAAREQGATFEEVERDLGSIGHERLGACLLEQWGIPFVVVEAVLHQHDGFATWPSGASAIALAHRLVEQRDGDTFDSDADRAFLLESGLHARLPALVAAARA